MSYYLVTDNNDDALKLLVLKITKLHIYDNIHVLSHSLNHPVNETPSCLFLKRENCSVGRSYLPQVKQLKSGKADSHPGLLIAHIFIT